MTRPGRNGPFANGGRAPIWYGGRGFLVLSLLALSVLWLCGCPTAGNPPLVLQGTVVNAITVAPISDAYVYVPASPRDLSSRQQGPPDQASLLDETDERGRFRLENVPTGDFTLRVAPPEGSDYVAPLEMEFRDVRPDTVLPEIRITLLDQRTLDQLSRSPFLRVFPSPVALLVGQTQQFRLDIAASGVPDETAPTWLLWGPIGTLNGDGMFRAETEGQGIVVALLGRFIASATVDVVSAAIRTPQIGVDLNADRDRGEAPLIVTFTGRAQPADPDNPIMGCRLNFGDETGSLFWADLPTSVPHTYELPGFYTGVLEARDTAGRAGFANKLLAITTPTVRPPEPSMWVSPTTLDFGETVRSLDLEITNVGSGTLSWSISGLPEWATATATDGSGDTAVEITADRSGRPPGDYSQIISIASNGGEASAFLRMTVPRAPSVVPRTLDFGELKDSLTLQIFNPSGGTMSWSISGLPAWATASQLSGSGDATVTIAVDRSDLPAAHYEATATVRLIRDGQTLDVAVRLLLDVSRLVVMPQ